MINRTKVFFKSDPDDMTEENLVKCNLSSEEYKDVFKSNPYTKLITLEQFDAFIGDAPIPNKLAEYGFGV